MSRRPSLLRNFDSGRHLDLVLVSAVTAVLGIRFGLALTGYPTVGGESLHIAHMLWGGLLMLVALVLLLSFAGRSVQSWAAVLGGLGFGTFVDEIGKFVTHDNDYFYRPAVSLIYVTLVLLYLIGRSLHRERLATREDHLANAVLELLEVVRGDLDRQEQERALRYLDDAGDEHPLAGELRAILQRADLVPRRPPTRVQAIARAAVDLYRRVATSTLFWRGLVAFFALRILVDGMRVSALLWRTPPGGDRLLDIPLMNLLPADPNLYGPAQWLQLASSLVSATFVATGIVMTIRLPRDQRARALRMFQRSVLVTVFLTQVFVFYQVEWAGLVGLVGNLLVFAALRFMITQESRRG